MEGSFPLERLPLELQVAIAEALDLPTRLALALASPSFHHAIFTYFNYYNGEFDNWEFLDESARHGYAVLLRWAVEHGSAIDWAVVLEAVKANHTDLALWLHRTLDQQKQHGTLRLNTKNDRKSCAVEAARNGNRELVDNFMERAVPLSLDLAASYAAKGGHVDLARDILSRSKMKRDVPLCRYAAKGGHLEAALSLCRVPNEPVATEYQAIFEGALPSGNLDLLRFAVDHGALLDSYCHELVFDEVARKLDVVKFLFDRFADYFEQFSFHFSMAACYYPSLDVIKYLSEERKIEFEDRHIKILLTYNEKENAAESRERFRCTKYLRETHLKSWSADSIEFNRASCWTNKEELSYLVSLCEGKVRFRALLNAYLDKLSSVEDFELFGYLVDQDGTLQLVSMDFILVAFMKNNLQVLEFLWTKCSAKQNLTELFPEALEGIFILAARVGGFATMKSLENISTIISRKVRRPRYRNLIAALNWFLSHGCNKADLMQFMVIEHKYFQEELGALLGQELRPKSILES